MIADMTAGTCRRQQKHAAEGARQQAHAAAGQHAVMRDGRNGSRNGSRNGLSADQEVSSARALSSFLKRSSLPAEKILPSIARHRAMYTSARCFRRASASGELSAHGWPFLELSLTLHCPSLTVHCLSLTFP